MPDITQSPQRPSWEPLFEIGRLLATPGAVDTLTEDEMFTALNRHVRGDWGDICEEDQAANDEALRDGLRILSSYHTIDDVKFWILTEADRSATTILLPSEY